MTAIPARPLILLTGATGYVGGRLLKALHAAGYPVRCVARRPEFLAPRVSPETEIVNGLRWLMIPVPLLTPWLSSLWLGLTTPVYARVGRGKRLGRTCSSVIAFAGELTLPCPPARHGKPSAVRSSDLQACITCAA